MIVKDVVVKNELGLHARPASMIVKTALKFQSVISIEKDGMSIDAKSIMNIMMLAAGQNSVLTLKVSGKDETEAIATLVELFENKFNEEA